MTTFYDGLETRASDPVRSPSGTLADPIELAHELGESHALAIRLRAELENWTVRWRDLWFALSREAHQRGWCSEYDEFARGIAGGLDRDEFMTDVDYEISADVHIDIDGDTILSALGIDNGAFSSATWSNTVAVTVTGDHRGMDGECVCGELDSRDEVADLLRDHGIYDCWIESISTSCDGCR